MGPVELYTSILQYILEKNSSLINPDRVANILERLAKKYPLVSEVQIQERTIIPPEGREDGEVLGALSIVLAAMYKVLEMFLGTKAAKREIAECVKEYMESHPDADYSGIKRYLPKDMDAKQKKPAAAKLPEGEPIKWLNFSIYPGEMVMLRGSGSSVEMLGLHFLRDGIIKGEGAYAVIGYPMEDLDAHLKALGISGKVKVLDWYSFKRKQVYDVVEEEGRKVMPKDPRFLGTEISEILKSEEKMRFFISFVSHALKFMDFETVYNFVYISKMKFKKRGVPCLFTVDPKGPGQEYLSNFDDVADCYMDIGEVRTSDEGWHISGTFRGPGREEDFVVFLPAPSGAEDRAREVFQIRLDHWRRQGYDVSELEKLMDGDIDELTKAFAEFREKVNKLKLLEREAEEKGLPVDSKEFKDVKKLPAAEEKVRKARSAPSPEKTEILDQMFRIALKGYGLDIFEELEPSGSEEYLANKLEIMKGLMNKWRKLEERAAGLPLDKYEIFMSIPRDASTLRKAEQLLQG